MKVVEAAAGLFSLDMEFVHADMGFALLEKEGTTFSDELFDKIRASDGFILGPADTYAYPPPDQGGRNPSSALRKGLDLFANIRPARTRGDLGYTRDPMDLVIVRENTEGFYADRNMFLGSGEFMPTKDVALAVRKVTRTGCERIARVAFEMAMTRKKKVAAIHKGNVLKISEGLFLEVVRDVAKDYPDVELEDVIVDAMAALLVRDPARFDVVLATNMYGDILSDEANELAGSIGLAPSINASEEIAMAQAQHGSAPDIAGQDKANPTSLILSAAMLLEWLGRRSGGDGLLQAAEAMDRAVDACLDDPERRTSDLGGPLGTQAFGDSVTAALKNSA